MIIKIVFNKIKIFLLIRRPSNSVFANYKSYIKSHTFAILKLEIELFVTSTSSFLFKVG